MKKIFSYRILRTLSRPARRWAVFTVLAGLGPVGCNRSGDTSSQTDLGSTNVDSTTRAEGVLPRGTFGYDLAFLREHQDLVVLKDKSGKAQVALSPAWQGRVLTSTADGAGGKSFGWINYDVIRANRKQPRMQAYGGEDRFWIGPQGGQFTIFFHPGDPFDFDHWFTPAPLDTEPFELVSRSDTLVRFHKRMRLGNYSNTSFEVDVKRAVRLIDGRETERLLGLNGLDGVRSVAFESRNEMSNAGTAPWRKETGLLSVWILGMFPPGPATAVVIPYREGPESKSGPVLNQYFVPILGKLPADRLKVGKGAVYYKADGNYCSKIGLGPQRAKPFLGSYDPVGKVLTIIQFTLPEGAKEYVNSSWEVQKEPYAGDAVNSYNDGALDHRPTPAATFYELESSSPALELRPGQRVTHLHRTFHFQGEEDGLDAVARATLGVSMAEIRSQFK